MTRAPWAMKLVAWTLLLSAPDYAVAQECSTAVGELASLEGTVELRAEGETAWRPARLSEPLCQSQTIRTGRLSRAAVLLANDEVLRLDEDTVVTLADIQQGADQPSVIRLILGALYSFSRSPRQVNVETAHMNLTVRGTEFLARTGGTESRLTVLEGQVVAANPQGRLDVAEGGAAVAGPGQAPQRLVLVRPRDAVQWALHYPPVLSAADAAPAGLGEAAVLLSVGRVDEARAAIDRALASDPDEGLAHALRAVIDVVQNREAEALKSAQRAVALSPEAAGPRIALSYAQQASFRLEAARDTLLEATARHPDDALASARLAEVWLALGYRDRARATADRAAALAPDTERVHVVRGFAALAEFDTAAARAAFAQAVVLDPADPLPRLGLGLARIREGGLKEGRREIDVAVGLGSSVALLRTYLGKAYFEERRDELAGRQYEIARELDPLDPTPYLYDAIRKQTENRPVEALADLERSIELNDNRAVYRSRLLLDEDRAARGTSLARIYDDLGFLELGANQAASSLASDPSNASAHRFLSDVYGGLRRRESARVSELLQAQMLQNININPVQPSLAEANLNIVTQGGPADPGFNEFTPLFERNRPQLTATGVAGNDDTLGGEAVASVLQGRYSISGGAFRYTTDGWRPNHDIEHTIYNLYFQTAVTPELNAQIELRRRETEEGDLDFNFDPDDFSPDERRELDQDTARVGLRWAPSPNSDLLLSLIYSDRDETVVDSDETVFGPFEAEGRIKEKGYQAEAQHLYRRDRFNLVAGGGFAEIDGDLTALATVASFPIIDLARDEKIQHSRGYLYGNFNLPEPVVWTLGVSFDDFEQEEISVEKVNPKAGLVWNVTDGVSLRAAAFRTVKPALVNNRNLEPTQVAGFNQLFDDGNGDTSVRYGLGLDWRLTQGLFAGAEATWRYVDAWFIDSEASRARSVDHDERTHRAFLFWTPAPRWALSAELVYDDFEAERSVLTVQDVVPEQVETVSLPLWLRYFHPSGFFAGLGTTLVRQEVERSPAAELGLDEGDENFVVLDASLGYRFPKRRGLISLEVNNLLDEGFRYQDDSFREFQDAPSIGPYIPERRALARLTLNW